MAVSSPEVEIKGGRWRGAIFMIRSLNQSHELEDHPAITLLNSVNAPGGIIGTSKDSDIYLAADEEEIEVWDPPSAIIMKKRLSMPSNHYSSRRYVLQVLAPEYILEAMNIMATFYMRESGNDMGFSFIEFCVESVGMKLALRDATKGTSGTIAHTNSYRPECNVVSRMSIIFLDGRDIIKYIKDILGKKAVIIEALSYLHHVLLDFTRHIPFDYKFVLVMEGSLLSQDIYLALTRVASQVLVSTGKQLYFLYIRKGADTDEVTFRTMEAMLNTDDYYQRKGWRAATYLITNEIKTFKFGDGNSVPSEWGKGRLVAYDVFRNFSTDIGDSFAGRSKRPSHLQDIITYLYEKEDYEQNAVITTYLYKNKYGWAQLRCGISIRFNFEHLCPELNMIFRDRRNRYEQPRVCMQYGTWSDDRDKRRSLASGLVLIGRDEVDEGPFDPNNNLGPDWDWY